MIPGEFSSPLAYNLYYLNFWSFSFFFVSFYHLHPLVTWCCVRVILWLGPIHLSMFVFFMFTTWLLLIRWYCFSQLWRALLARNNITTLLEPIAFWCVYRLKAWPTSYILFNMWCMWSGGGLQSLYILGLHRAGESWTPWCSVSSVIITSYIDFLY